MRVDDIMTPSPRTCSERDTLRSVAQAMEEGDFGAIVVVDGDHRPIGVCTDRDIAIRAVAQGRSPDTAVGEIMTRNCCSVSRETDDREVLDLMERQQLHRIVVVDGSGCVCGIVATADMARAETQEESGELLQEISQPV